MVMHRALNQIADNGRHDSLGLSTRWAWSLAGTLSLTRPH